MSKRFLKGHSKPTLFVPKCGWLSSFANRLGWEVCAEGFLCHVVSCCGVGSCAAASADLSVGASAALAFEAFGVAHSCQVLVVLPDIGEGGLEDVAAIDGQVAAWEDVALVAYEEHAQSGQATFRGAVGVDGAAGDCAAGMACGFGAFGILATGFV